ncbi:MAG: hypothetical protein ACI8TQ_003519 [Planctomycetota bacterium]|jgi:hypothetical protein
MMKLRSLFLPSALVGFAVVLSTPAETEGFAVFGFSLNPNESDFRVFNNFTDPQANDNTTMDSQFPGYTGAVLAIWKGAVEWASFAHGDGSGDPSQAVLGSAGSSFDPIFNGHALGIGVIGDNIVSQIDIVGGGVLAFFQGGNDGWWIRFHNDVVLNDGPGANLPVNHFDIQGLLAHEYGHAIGLDHSTAPGSPTMTAAALGNAVQNRSIESDDILGARFIYGVANASGTKPFITQVVNLGTQLRIIGTNFKQTNNEVWFTLLTPATGAAGGDPIKVTGLSSVGGQQTEILMAIPPDAGPGDLFVKRNSAGQESSSAPFPFDPFSGPAPLPTISSIVPSQVPSLTPNGGVTVVLTGTGFTNSLDLRVNNKQVGQLNSSFSGSWSIDSDTQVTFDMPLTNGGGLVDVELMTPSGPAITQLEIVAPPTPTLAVSAPNLIQSVGISFAGSSESLDVMLLDFSAFDGPTVIPGVLELEIGGGNLNNVKKLKTWTMGPKFWRKLDIGPVTGLPVGLEIFFEGLVLPVSQGYATPWTSTNKHKVTVLL